MQHPQRTKLWSLQVLRFVAAFLVVDFHARNMAFVTMHDAGVLGPGATKFGKCGVDIFFVISGFIITRTSRGLGVFDFLVRRAKRILPPYLMLAPFWIGQTALTGQLGWRDLVATLLLWPVTDRLTAPLGPVAWTLCFEALFYAAAALVIWKPKLIWWIAGAYGAALILRSNALLQFLGNPIIIEFLLGVGLAFLPPWRPAVVFIVVGAAVLLVGAAVGLPLTDTTQAHLDGSEGWTRLTLMGLPCALIVWGALQIQARKGLLTYLGDASYSLYLIHAPVAAFTVVVLARFTTLPVDFVILGASLTSVLVACRFHELFEKPALAWLGSSRWNAAPRPAP